MGYTIKKGAKLPPLEDIKQEHTLAVEAMLPAGPETILRALHKLRLGTVSRDLSEDDRQAQVLLYAEHLASYPAVVVNEAIEHLLSNARFFPPLADVLAACNKALEEPCALLRCLEGMLELAAGRPAALCGLQPWQRLHRYGINCAAGRIVSQQIDAAVDVADLEEANRLALNWIVSTDANNDFDADDIVVPTKLR